MTDTLEVEKIEPGYLTIKQVSEYTQMPVSTIRKNIYSGKLKAYRPGRSLRFRKDDVEKWIRAFPAA